MNYPEKSLREFRNTDQEETVTPFLLLVKPADPLEAGQYTGVRDVLKNQIFENDIIEYVLTGTRYKAVY